MSIPKSRFGRLRKDDLEAFWTPFVGEIELVDESGQPFTKVEYKTDEEGVGQLVLKREEDL